jgi:dTDP-4-dehydrorhamnose reductase
MFCNLTQAKNPVSTPTWARTLAQATAQIIAQGRGEPVGYVQDKAGLYHLTDSGSCSRYDWAKAIITSDPSKNGYLTNQILPAKSEDFKTSAQRPKLSTLDKQNFLTDFPLRPPLWTQSLTMALIS